MTSKLIIKEATENDIPLLLTFIHALADYEKLSHEVVVTEAMLQEALFGKRSLTEAIIAYLDDTPAGFALYFHNFSTFLGRAGLYLEDLFVKPEKRGAGIGKKLLVHLAKIAVERHCGRLELSVLNWNASAISFYKQIGAIPQDEWTVYRLTNDALLKLATSSP